MTSFKYLFGMFKLSAKIMAAVTVCSGAVEALVHTSTALGLLLSWMGIAIYAAFSALPDKGYDRTDHVPPRAPVKSSFKGVPMRLPSLHELPLREPVSQQIVSRVLPLRKHARKA